MTDPLREALFPFANAARLAGIGGASKSNTAGSKAALRGALGCLTVEDFALANAAYYEALSAQVPEDDAKLIQRLRAPLYWWCGSSPEDERCDTAPIEAADRIEELSRR